MAWLDRETTRLWHTTGNHTTYDAMSEAVFRTSWTLPRNGPPGQEGLSYWVRRDDLLLVFVHTLFSGLGGEGHVETGWLRSVLHQHADARHKLVIGHHPVHPVNGFSGAYQREIGPEHAAAFWDALVRRRCNGLPMQSHPGVRRPGPPRRSANLHRRCRYRAPNARGDRIPARGPGGTRCGWATLSGARHRRPGSRVPVLARRAATAHGQWRKLQPGESERGDRRSLGGPDRCVPFHRPIRPAGQRRGANPAVGVSIPASRRRFGSACAGREQRLTVILGPEPRRSPHYWIGPPVAPDTGFDFQLLIHAGMGPGGIYVPFRDGPGLVIARRRLALGCRTPALAGSLERRPRPGRRQRPRVPGFRSDCPNNELTVPGRDRLMHPTPAPRPDGRSCRRRDRAWLNRTHVFRRDTYSPG